MRSWRRAALAGGIAAVVLGLGWGAWWLSARARWNEAVRAWEAELGPIDAMLAAHPDAGPNDTAFALERAAAALGVELSALPGSARAPTLPRDIGTAAWAHAMSGMRSPSPGTTTPPPDLERFLDDHAAELDAVLEVLDVGPPPRWALTVSDRFDDQEAPPGVLGLHTLLCAAALADVHRNRLDRAARRVAAARQLARGIEARPDVGSQMVGGLMLLAEQPVVHALPAGLAPMDPALSRRPPMRAAVALDGWTVASLIAERRLEWDLHHFRSHRGPLEQTWLRIRATLLRPRHRIEGASLLLETLEALRRDDRAGSCPAKGFPPRATPWLAVEAVLREARRFDFHQERTSVIEQARRNRAPGTVPGTCDRWSFRVDLLSDGRVIVSTVGIPPRLRAVDSDVATTWVEAAR